MIIGLGTGSTAYFAVERVGEKLRSGELKDVTAVPTSKRTQDQAEKLGAGTHLFMFHIKMFDLVLVLVI